MNVFRDFKFLIFMIAISIIVVSCDNDDANNNDLFSNFISIPVGGNFYDTEGDAIQDFADLTNMKIEINENIITVSITLTRKEYCKNKANNAMISLF